MAVRTAVRRSALERLETPNGSNMPDANQSGYQNTFEFYKDEGGFLATDASEQPLDKVYYLGIIDILTPYDLKKKGEHFFKGFSADRVSNISGAYCICS